MKLRVLLLAAVLAGCHGTARSPASAPHDDDGKPHQDPILDRLEKPATFEQLVVVTPDVAWALADDRVLLKSMDAGRTFRPVKSPLLAKLADEADGQALSLAAASERVAWIVERISAAESEPMHANAPLVRVHRTEDGGKTWATTALRSPVYAEMVQMNVKLFDDSHGSITFERFVEDTGEILETFHTADAGRTWKRAREKSNGPFVLPAPAHTSETVEPTSAIAFFGVKKAEGIVIGTSGAQSLFLYRSHDAGATWHMDARRDALNFCAADVGEEGAVAVVVEPATQRTLLVRSTRHGFWDEIAELPMSCPTHVRAFSKLNLFVASIGPGPGEAGIFHSTDGGRTWHEVGRRVDDP